MAKRKREEATVSFHYFIREKRNEGNPPEILPFTDEQFAAFCARLIAQPDIDLNDDDTCKHLKTTDNAPIEQCELVNERTLFGRFRSLYSGHSYDNTDVGEVPDSSVSLRPFFFLTYLSESGRIYVGSQYLGQFGGYSALRRTLCDFLPDGVVSHTFRHNATSYTGARPTEIQVNFSRKSADITDPPKFGQRGALSFKQTSSKDEKFNTTVSTKLLAKLGQSDAVIKKAIADMFSENELLDIKDDEIENCKVIATLNGKNTTINVIESGHFATRFRLEIEDYIKGHPDREKSKAAMLKLLEKQIIEKSENV